MSNKTFDDLYNEYKKPSDADFHKFRRFVHELKEEIGYCSDAIEKDSGVREIYATDDNYQSIYFNFVHKCGKVIILMLRLKGEDIMLKYRVETATCSDAIEICRQKINQFNMSAEDFVKMLSSLITDIKNDEL